MLRCSVWILTVAVSAIALPVIAGEPDWFTRVREQGLTAACEEEVKRHEKGLLEDSLHTGECYFNLKRYADGVEVFARLRRSPDKNYAAAALSRIAEGYYHLARAEEARAAFKDCLEKYPEAWLDGSIPELCRAWLRKMDGRLESPDLEPDDDKELKVASEKTSLGEMRAEIRDLTKRLAELKKLIRDLEKDD